MIQQADETRQPKTAQGAQGEAFGQAGKWLVFLIVGISIFMSTLDSSIVNIALPTIMADLSVSMETIQWVVVIYLATVTSLLLAFGRLSDIFGRRYVFLRGLLIFTAGSALCGVAPSAAWLIGSRCFQAMGAAMIMACTPALIVDTFPPSERGRGLGMMGTTVAAGMTVGPALGGLILKFFPWRVIFYINIPVGAAAVIATLKILKAQNHGRLREPFDWPGAVLLAVACTSFLYGVSHAEQWGVWTLKTLGMAGVFIVSLLFLLACEKKGASPLLDLSLWRIRLFTASILAAVAMFMSLFMAVFLLPFFLQQPAGFSPGKTGLFMVVPFLFLSLGAPLAGGASDKIGSRLPSTLGMCLLAASFFSLGTLDADAGTWPLFWRLALTGIGTALFSSPNSLAVMNAVPEKRRGVAAGTVATARNLGMVMGVAMASAVFNAAFASATGGIRLAAYRPEFKEAFMTAFHLSTFCGGLVAFIGAVLSYLKGKEGPRTA